MSDNPKLSIITVNLNNRDGLQRTIDSVVSQTFTDYEWIVIDGGSTDGSRELIEQYQDHFAYWCSEPDKGIYNAMNKGIAHAKGEWLQFLNSGDWLYDNATLENAFNKNWDCDVLYGNVVHVCNKKNIYIEFPSSVDFYYFINNYINHQATFTKSEIFKTHLFNESLRIYADWELCLNLLFEGKRFEHTNQYIAYYDFNGMSSNLTQMHTDEHAMILNKFADKHIASYLFDVNKVFEDIVLLNNYKEKEKTLNTHRSYRFIMKLSTKIIIILQRIINIIENNRK